MRKPSRSTWSLVSQSERATGGSNDFEPRLRYIVALNHAYDSAMVSATGSATVTATGSTAVSAWTLRRS